MQVHRIESSSTLYLSKWNWRKNVPHFSNVVERVCKIQSLIWCEETLKDRIPAVFWHNIYYLLFFPCSFFCSSPFNISYIVIVCAIPTSNCNNINQGNNFSSGSLSLMSLALKECGHTQTINIINGVCLMKEELLGYTMASLQMKQVIFYPFVIESD